jgi:U1 small nuclear ribonucleoprotein
VQVVLVRDRGGKSRGYAFIQYEVEQDLKDAFRRGDARKIDGRR